ncbi:F0F1 ATP synthase subunit epsilon [Patescibacteria group bacterium]|nr:F0F1 ATP synthase subunit epsilon [Patescibacteria group bacterium]
MTKTFHLTVARVGENIFDGEAVSVTLPGSEGVFTVLAGHEPFVSELKEGEARIEAVNGEKHHVPIHDGGVAEISGGQATVLL